MTDHDFAIINASISLLSRNCSTGKLTDWLANTWKAASKAHHRNKLYLTLMSMYYDIIDNADFYFDQKMYETSLILI